MRGHEHDLDGPGTLRPAPARIEEHHGAQAHAVPAVLGGRPDVLTADSLTHLQRTAGNAAVSQRLAGEHDDDGHADGHDGHDHGHDQPSPVHEVTRSGGGRPLDPQTRADMEGRLGHDFSDVRVHDDARAHDSAVAVNAHAYTVGSDVVFQRDRYDPTSDAGRLTLAHELTHVVQQRSGPVDGTPAPGGVRISDPGDRFEREAAANAERVMSQPAPVAALAGGGAGAGAPAAVQREAAPEEEEPVQGSFAPGGPAVQRDAAPEEEEPVQGSFAPGGPAVQRDEVPDEEPAE